MKQIYRTLLILMPSLAIAFCFILCPQSVTSAVKYALRVCADTLIPSLLPFMVLADFIMESGLIRAAAKPLKGITKFLFNLPGEAGGVILTGVFGGYPVGPNMTEGLMNRGIITQVQAQKLMLFSINAGPAFVIGAVGFGMMGSTKVGIILYVSVVLATLITGIIVCRKLEYSSNSSDFHIKNPSLGLAVSRSVDLGTKSMIAISAYFIIFSAVFEVINIAGKQLGLNTEMLCTVLEVTKGCKVISSSTFSADILIPILAAAISFGGVCVHCQISDNIRGVGLSYFSFFKARVLSAILAAIIGRTIIILLPEETYVFSNMAAEITTDFSMSIISCAAALLMSILLILDLDIKKELC